MRTTQWLSGGPQGRWVLVLRSGFVYSQSGSVCFYSLYVLLNIGETLINMGLTKLCSISFESDVVAV